MREDWEEHLLTQVAEGRSISEICRDDEGMPSRFVVHRALVASELDGEDGFAHRYARACAARADVMFDEMLVIADTPKEGRKVKLDKDGNEVEVQVGDMIEHRRLQVDTRKWALARMSPKKYGDKFAVGGADDLPGIKTEMSLEEGARRLAFMLTAATRKEPSE